MADVIFTGSSLTREEASSLHPSATVMPPVRRGELYRLCREQSEPTRVLVVDGLFSVGGAPPPSEFVDVASHAGMDIFGVSSMGALRAIECAPAGVIGLGVIYRLYRLGVIETDAEVAVGVDSDNDYHPTTVPLVDVRWYLSQARRRGLIDWYQHRAVLDLAKSCHFLERTPRYLDRIASEHGLTNAFWSQLVTGGGLKKRDASSAIRLLAKTTIEPQDRVRSTIPRRPLRYVSPDPSPPDRDDSVMPFCRWFFASGEYQNFLWPIVLIHAMKSGCANAKEVTDSEAARKFAGSVIKSLLDQDDSYVESIVADELSYMEELHKLRWLWTGMIRLAGLVENANPRLVRYAQDELAIRQGFGSFLDMLESTDDGLIHESIPLTDFHQAASLRARSLDAAANASPRLLK